MTSAATAAIERRADLAEIRDRIKSGRTQGPYYVALLGLRTYDTLRLYASIRKGFSFAAFDHLQRNVGVTAQALAELTEIPIRTLARRKAQGRLDPEESDRLVRLARVFGRALELFEGDADAARTWLSATQRAFDGLMPLTLAKTDIGATEVENVIGRLEYGIPT